MTFEPPCINCSYCNFCVSNKYTTIKTIKYLELPDIFIHMALSLLDWEKYTIIYINLQYVRK